MWRLGNIASDSVRIPRNMPRIARFFFFFFSSNLGSKLLPKIINAFPKKFLSAFHCRFCMLFTVASTPFIFAEAPSSTLTHCEMNSHGLAQHSLRRERGHIKAQLHHHKCARPHRMFGTEVCCAPQRLSEQGNQGRACPDYKNPSGYP